MVSHGSNFSISAHSERLLIGDIVYGTVLGTPIIVINSFKVAEDLLIKKSSGYSFRPRSVFIHEM
jgi:hypothetical protein